MVPGSPALEGHPKNIYLPEVAVLTPVNSWIGHLLARENLDQTVDALVASQADAPGIPGVREVMKQRVAEAEARLRRLRVAIEAGVDPGALVDASTTRTHSSQPPEWS